MSPQPVLRLVLLPRIPDPPPPTACVSLLGKATALTPPSLYSSASCSSSFQRRSHALGRGATVREGQGWGGWGGAGCGGGGGCGVRRGRGGGSNQRMPSQNFQEPFQGPSHSNPACKLPTPAMYMLARLFFTNPTSRVLPASIPSYL